MLWIKVIQHWICIRLRACCENCYLVGFICCTKGFYCKWSYINSSLHHSSSWKSHFNELCMLLCWLFIFQAMYQSFIQIKNYKFFKFRRSLYDDFLFLQLFLIYFRQLSHHLTCKKCSVDMISIQLLLNLFR